VSLHLVVFRRQNLTTDTEGHYRYCRGRSFSHLPGRGATRRCIDPEPGAQRVLFLYTEVLQQPLAAPLNAVRAKQPQRLPTVLTREEVRCVLDAMSGVHHLMAKWLYGSGPRLLECLMGAR
jgi:hypothetical protein